jgi:BlaI family penicillinase repressor
MAHDVQISGAEWVVMERVWAGGPCTAADVIKQLQVSHDWNHSTIRTLLARLVEKGALDYEVDGTRYIYRAAVSREKCLRQEGRSFLQKAFGGDVTALVAHFVSDSALRPDQLKQLRQLLSDKASKKE